MHRRVIARTIPARAMGAAICRRSYKQPEIPRSDAVEPVCAPRLARL